MSVSVADLLKLPSLRNACVIAGEKGLSQSVSSISVLESTDPGLLTGRIFVNNAFYGSEIVITGFVNIPNDVTLQCANMRRLAEVGEVGLILFYVGALMPEVDQKLIDIANEMDFALICMPQGRLDLRYSEVIYEVVDAIVRDQMTEASFVAELRQGAFLTCWDSESARCRRLCASTVPPQSTACCRRKPRRIKR